MNNELHYALNFQWEYQIGPCPGETIGDHLNMSRYFLQRLAEIFGLRVTFHPVPVHGSPLTSSGHLNFSTSKMRAKGGITYVLTDWFIISLVPYDNKYVAEEQE